ncbi:hypothetical protein LTR35_009659 [Friedmanniomyces endolithicus]|uniref:Uncharacterized protein n=1 Tax=Friedmanniomyces endolithicus TaxID=329885 RepID=A0AAN6FPN3_9PEZI|nr:hypothetical protein LTR35_009659 [Friedmanniomyces endolithicus]KAK0301135.1 hypothetical protein LTS00_000284 [Friedmanniomyces endolithicus]KAK0321275.1 hypothetical protein LTR82_007727 [Friedmanniomyces endolithicus]KAK0975799.1 hypothetical protein LTR54_016700 [Friedmanniomyces endolithicus]
MSTNGASNNSQSSSKFLSHVTSYPVVNSSIETFKSNPYGKQALEIADSTYQRFGKPVEPYLEGPYSYAKPYVAKADELADSGLQRVDGRFPIMKEDTDKVLETSRDYVFWPVNYLYGTYNDEYRKTASHDHKDPNSAGLITLVKAVLSTELRIAADFFQFVANFFGPHYEEQKKKGADYMRQGQETAQHYREAGKSTLLDYQQMGQQKAGEYADQGREMVEQVRGQAADGVEQAKGSAWEGKEQIKGQAQQGREELRLRSGAK